MASSSHFLLLSVPTTATFTATRYTPPISIQIPQAHLLFLEVQPVQIRPKCMIANAFHDSFHPLSGRTHTLPTLSSCRFAVAGSVPFAPAIQ